MQEEGESGTCKFLPCASVHLRLKQCLAELRTQGVFCCRLAKKLCRVQVRAAATEKQEDVDIEEDAVPEYFPNVVLAGCCKTCLQ